MPSSAEATAPLARSGHRGAVAPHASVLVAAAGGEQRGAVDELAAEIDRDHRVGVPLEVEAEEEAVEAEAEPCEEDHAEAEARRRRPEAAAARTIQA